MWRSATTEDKLLHFVREEIVSPELKGNGEKPKGD